MIEMSRLRTWALIILIVLAMGMAPMVVAPPESETISISDTDDDGFLLEIGVIVDSSLVHILDPGQDLVAYVRFQGLDIEYWEPLTNATLRLATSTYKPFDNSTVTIYGMAFDDLQDQTITPGFLSSVPLTSANVVYNTSNFDGPNWHEIDVTEIVQELKSRFKWDSGDDVGLVIYGPEGHDTRYFYDYLGNPSLSAQLVVHWNHEPSPPFPGAVFIETYGDNYSIWSYDGGWLNFSTFTVIGVDKTGGLNDTWFQLTNFYDDTQGWLRRNFTDDGSGIYNVKFGIKWEGLPWNGPANYEWYGLWGVSSDHDQVHGFDEGYSTQGRTWSDRGAGSAWSHTGGALSDSHSVIPQYMEVDLPWTLYFNITLNFHTRAHIHEAYNDIDMTDLNLTTSKVYATGPVYSVGLFIYEYLFAPSIVADQDTGITCEYISRTDMEEYIVTNENGTILVDGLDTLEDAEDWIGGSDPDPQDPDPGGEWTDSGTIFTRFNVRMGIFLIGFFMFWGTIWFFSWKRPDGYYLLVGALVIVMACGLMIHSMSV